jgi:glucokinase
MSYAIGIDLGGRNIKFVAITPQGEIRVRATAPTYDDGSDWAQTIQALIQKISKEQGQAALCVGLSAPGLAAPDGRSILWMQGRLEQVQGLDWTSYLGFEETVTVLNDAQAALLGEIWLGAARGARNAILLTLGTGVGGGIVCDGHLLRGHIGRAGHLGHISLNIDGAPDIVNTPGSLEDAIGDCTVHERSHGRFESTYDLVEAHRAGDGVATKIWLRSVKFLAAGVVSLVNVVDPEIVIIGGGIAVGAGDVLFEPLQHYVERWEWRPTGNAVKIVPAQLSEYAGACGAAYEALLRNNLLDETAKKDYGG